MTQDGSQKAPARHARPKPPRNRLPQIFVAVGLVAIVVASNVSASPSQVASSTVEAQLQPATAITSAPVTKSVQANPATKPRVTTKAATKPKVATKPAAKVSAKPRAKVKFVIKSVTKPVRYSTYRTKDKSLVRGTQKIKRPGKSGKAIIVYRVRYVNGKAVSRSEVRRNIVVAPQPKVVVDGVAKPTTTPTGSGTSLADLDSMPLGTVSQIQAYAQSYTALKYDWSWAQFQCLVTLWDHESHWNYRAYNSGSGATGIPQALPGSKMSSFGDDWRTNPATQIKWGASYIDGRYGNPCGALGHWNSRGWY